MSEVQDLNQLFRLIAALEPWLDQVVIVGGWAHQLFRLHPNAQQLDYLPLRTLDTDIAVPTDVPVRDENIRARLLNHGFTENFLGHDRPPATHYHLSGEKTGFYAEFLTPLIGAEHSRQGGRRATTEISGITSQQLRHIEILLHHPWNIRLRTKASEAAVRIANPVGFLAQKILIHGKRDREHRAKDILYMHDTLEIFGAKLEELHALWQDIVRPTLLNRHANQVCRASQHLFGSVTDDVRGAAAISAQRRLSAEAIQLTCQYGFNELFGSGRSGPSTRW